MKQLWEQIWFINLITFCRKWAWFEKYIYSNSISMEDFVRNPCDGLNRALAIKGVHPYSLINFRIFFVRPLAGWFTFFDFQLMAPWVTKFSNAWLWFQISVCFRWIIPIPCIMLHFRPTYHWYFQAALGMAPDLDTSKVPSEWYCMPYAKFRFVNDKTSNEIIWNPTDQRGWNEGGI